MAYIFDLVLIVTMCKKKKARTQLHVHFSATAVNQLIQLSIINFCAKKNNICKIKKKKTGKKWCFCYVFYANSFAYKEKNWHLCNAKFEFGALIRNINIHST